MGRAAVRALVAGIDPFDGVERAHRAETLAWIDSGAPLYRVAKPDVPPRHLVCYCVVREPERGELLLVAHRGAGLWLPPGGHVEPGEGLWDAVVRECAEELALSARPAPAVGRRPLFLTVNRTRGAGPHTDVCLWYLLHAFRAEVVRYDPGEFSAVAWWTPARVLAAPVDVLDPHLHRFVGKLAALG